MSDTIEFPGRQEWDANRKSLLILAVRGDRTVICVLTFEAICYSHSHDPLCNPLKPRKTVEDLYVKHQAEIHEACRRLIEADADAESDEIVIRSI